MRSDKGDAHVFLRDGKEIKQQITHYSPKMEGVNFLVNMTSKVFNGNTAKLLRGKLPEIDSVTKRIDDLVTGFDIDIRDFYCVTFIGYSRLEYESPDLLKKTLKLKLEQCLQEHPGKQIIVVSGGTEVGIGAVYNLVREDELLRDNVKCIGIVSAESIKSEVYELALSKDKIAIVPALDGSWQTKSPSGYPYILYPAHKYGGEVVALGGGLISYEEANAAKKKGIKTSIFPFHSNNNELRKRLREGEKYSDLCSILYYEFGEKDVI
ncbi:hypothetical protein AB1D78_004083 [Escherichia coli]